MTSDQPTAILILGMHRSGISAITQVLNLLGVPLSGGAYTAENENVSVQRIKEGDWIRVGWRFKCLLKEGACFFNAGVKETLEGGYLHRVIDAIMVRVVKIDDLIMTSFCLKVDSTQLNYID